MSSSNPSIRVSRSVSTNFTFTCGYETMLRRSFLAGCAALIGLATVGFKPHPRRPRTVIVQIKTHLLRKGDGLRWNESASEKALPVLMDSLQRLGMVQALRAYFNGVDYTVVDGNLRLRAAKAIGMETVPVLLLSKADYEQEQQWLIQMMRESNAARC